MTVDKIHGVIILLLVVYGFLLNHQIKKLKRRVKDLGLYYAASIELIKAEQKRKEKHAEVLGKLTDPEQILMDMERGARVREMHDANRTTLPREDAGPPAKVYSPRLRAKVPKSNFKKNPD